MRRWGAPSGTRPTTPPSSCWTRATRAPRRRPCCQVRACAWRMPSTRLAAGSQPQDAGYVDSCPHAHAHGVCPDLHQLVAVGSQRQATAARSWERPAVSSGQQSVAAPAPQAVEAAAAGNSSPATSSGSSSSCRNNQAAVAATTKQQASSKQQPRWFCPPRAARIWRLPPSACAPSR